MTTRPSPRHSSPTPYSAEVSPHRAVALAALVALGMAVLLPVALVAQEAGLPAAQMGQQTLRPYWHVFVAYTIVILMIGGWAFSIARRLRDVEDRLVD